MKNCFILVLVFVSMIMFAEEPETSDLSNLSTSASKARVPPFFLFKFDYHLLTALMSPSVFINPLSFNHIE